MKFIEKRVPSRYPKANPGIIIIFVIIVLLFILALIRVVEAGGI